MCEKWRLSEMNFQTPVTHSHKNPTLQNLGKKKGRKKKGIPNNALPCGSILVILFFYVHPDIMLLIQLIPIHQSILVSTNRLKAHSISILLINYIFELQIVIKLTFTEILKKMRKWKEF